MMVAISGRDNHLCWIINQRVSTKW